MWSLPGFSQSCSSSQWLRRDHSQPVWDWEWGSCRCQSSMMISTTCMVSDRLTNCNPNRLYLNISACMLWKLRSAVSSLTSQSQAGRKSRSRSKVPFFFFPPYRVVPENLEVQITFTSAVWACGERGERCTRVRQQLDAYPCINITTHIPTWGAPVAKLTVIPEPATALESQVWRVCVSQLSGQRLPGGPEAGGFPGGVAPRPPLLPAAQGRLSRRCNIHGALPGCGEQPPLGSAHHAWLPAGRLVSVHDAPGSGRGTHVQSDHPAVQEPATGRLSSGTSLLLLYQPDPEPGERLLSPLHGTGHMWVWFVCCVFTTHSSA